MFDSTEEITQKLGNTVVIHRDRPFYVIGGKTRTHLTGYYPNDRAEVAISLKDPDLNFRNLGERLGYMNLETINRHVFKEATYLMRMPIRRSVQGLSSHNMFIQGVRDNPRTNAPGIRQPQWGPFVFEENYAAFLAAINNRYPSVSGIRREMTGDNTVSSRAFHKHWAVSRDHAGVNPFAILYKMEKVGYTEDLERFVLAKRYSLLQKDLDDARTAA